MGPTKVAPQSRIRTAVLYELLRLTHCQGQGELVEFNLSALARTLGCTSRIVRYWIAYLSQRAIVKRLDARGGAGRGLRLRVNLAALRFRLAAERRNSEIPLIPLQKEEKIRICRAGCVPLAAAQRASPAARQGSCGGASRVTGKAATAADSAASGTTVGSGIASKRPARASRGLLSIGQHLGAAEAVASAASGPPPGAEWAGEGEKMGCRELARQPLFRAPHTVREAVASLTLFQTPDVIKLQDRSPAPGAGAPRAFSASAKISRPAPGRECTHGRCGAWCRYIRSDDEIASSITQSRKVSTQCVNFACLISKQVVR
jgi:hypothetical protein